MMHLFLDEDGSLCLNLLLVGMFNEWHLVLLVSWYGYLVSLCLLQQQGIESLIL